MALDSAVAEQMTMLSVFGAKAESARIGAIAENAVQTLNVISANLLHQHGGTGDDPATMAALRTAIHVPEKQV